jgi:hypothetical protein
MPRYPEIATIAAACAWRANTACIADRPPAENPPTAMRAGSTPSMVAWARTQPMAAVKSTAAASIPLATISLVAGGRFIILRTTSSRDRGTRSGCTSTGIVPGSGSSGISR